ncbi:oxygen-independent coproporphyrinogen III oxidase domain protein, partial [Vibrio parahaemolyticus VP-48]
NTLNRNSKLSGIKRYWISTTIPVLATRRTQRRWSFMKRLPSQTMIWHALSTQSVRYRCTYTFRFAISFATTVVVIKSLHATRTKRMNTSTCLNTKFVNVLHCSLVAP